MKIIIETIPHKKQRYPTVGDWYYDQRGVLHIKVSKLSNWKREALIAAHELMEALLCKEAGITQEQVDKFDMEFERKRKRGDTAEPGDSLRAPYFFQHRFASKVESQLAKELGVSWEAYEKELEKL